MVNVPCYYRTLYNFGRPVQIIVLFPKSGEIRLGLATALPLSVSEAQRKPYCDCHSISAIALSR